MKIKIICIGNIKEKYLIEGIKDYSKRISRFGKLEIIELNEERLTTSPSKNDILICLKKEAEKILNKIDPKSYVISLCVEGKDLDSNTLAKNIETIYNMSYSEITFIIGSSYGLNDIIKQRSNLCLSFSRLTFPHQLIRLVLLEQIYRCFKIINNETYHK